MQGMQWQTLKGPCFAFLMPLRGQPCTGTSLKPCFNLSELANRPPAGLQALAICALVCTCPKRMCVCVCHEGVCLCVRVFAQKGEHGKGPA